MMALGQTVAVQLGPLESRVFKGAHQQQMERKE
jgi:hypothetical protein